MKGSAADLETDGAGNFGLLDRRPSTETDRDAHSDTGQSAQAAEGSQNQRFSQKVFYLTGLYGDVSQKYGDSPRVSQLVKSAAYYLKPGNVGAVPIFLGKRVTRPRFGKPATICENTSFCRNEGPQIHSDSFRCPFSH